MNQSSVTSTIEAPKPTPHSISLPNDDDRTDRALRFSIWDGVWFSCMQAIIDTFAIVGAVHLHAPMVAIGLLAGLPLLIGSIGQLVLPRFEAFSAHRKRHVLFGTGGQSFSLILLAFTGWIPGECRPWAYVVIFTIQGFFGNVISGLWMAWMSDLVKPSARGRYFARRNVVINTAQLIFGLCVGVLAFRNTAENTPWIFFCLIFVTAGLFRLLSTATIGLQYHPPYISKTIRDKTVAETKTPRDLLSFCIASALMQGAVAIASPFFTVWYTRDLHFNFFMLSAATAATVLGTILTLPLWGKLSDRIGHRKVMLICGFMISTVPLPFIFCNQPWIVCALNMNSGIWWGGYNLSNFNYLLSLSSIDPERRTSMAVALSGISVFIFTLLGGFLASRLPTIMEWQLQSLFLLSAILRLAVYAVLFLKVPRRGFESIKKRTRFRLQQPARRMEERV